MYTRKIYPGDNTKLKKWMKWPTRLFTYGDFIKAYNICSTVQEMQSYLGEHSINGSPPNLARIRFLCHHLDLPQKPRRQRHYSIIARRAFMLFEGRIDIKELARFLGITYNAIRGYLYNEIDERWERTPEKFRTNLPKPIRLWDIRVFHYIRLHPMILDELLPPPEPVPQILVDIIADYTGVYPNWVRHYLNRTQKAYFREYAPIPNPLPEEPPEPEDPRKLPFHRYIRRKNVPNPIEWAKD